MCELLTNDHIGCKRVDAIALSRLSDDIYTIIAFGGVVHKVRKVFCGLCSMHRGPGIAADIRHASGTVTTRTISPDIGL
jgi:hypothetical protein